MAKAETLVRDQAPFHSRSRFRLAKSFEGQGFLVPENIFPQRLQLRASTLVKPMLRRARLLRPNICNRPAIKRLGCLSTLRPDAGLERIAGHLGGSCHVLSGLSQQHALSIAEDRCLSKANAPRSLLSKRLAIYIAVE